jgi:hypothetical protein
VNSTDSLRPRRTNCCIYQRCWGGASVNDNRNQLLGFIVNDAAGSTTSFHLAPT